MDANYAHLADAYDELFPVDPDALVFIEDSLAGVSGRRVVDAGCGTGSLARDLADRGADVFGFDLDSSLLAKADEKALGLARLRFARADLTQWVLPEGWSDADAVVSLGNTLPHLNTEAAVRAFLDRTKKNLCPRGTLLVQVLDYDRLERERLFDLPVRTVGSWTFRRRYEVRPDGLWMFHTQIDGPQGRATEAFPLRPWKRAELESLLTRSGFEVTGVYGGFDRSLPGASLPLVLEARLA